MLDSLPSRLDQDELACGYLEYLRRQTLEACEGLTRIEPPPTLPALREELLGMVVRDQAVRRPGADQSTWKAVDAANLARMKAIVAELGFPTYEMVGGRGVDAAWLLVQHADTDLDFQKEALDRMRGLNLGARHNEYVASLTDRVLTGEGAPQVYGTQPGQPIDDPEHVDERRARVGLMPLASYNCVIERRNGPARQIKPGK